MRIPPPPPYPEPLLKEDGSKPANGSRSSAPKLVPVSRARLLSEIKSGKKLNETKVDDRSSPIVDGKVRDNVPENEGPSPSQRSSPPFSTNIGRDRACQDSGTSPAGKPQKRFVTSTGGDIMSEISKEIMKRNKSNQGGKPEVPKPLKLPSEDPKDNESSLRPVSELPEDDDMKLGKDISLSKLSEIATRKRPPPKPPIYKAASTRCCNRNKLPPRSRLSGCMNGFNKSTTTVLTTQKETPEIPVKPPLLTTIKNQNPNKSATSILMHSDSNSSSLDLGPGASSKEDKPGVHNSSEKDDIIYFHRWYFKNDLPEPRPVNKKA